MTGCWRLPGKSAPREAWRPSASVPARPAVQPERITEHLVSELAKIDGLWFVTHFDHPEELTPEAERACRLLVASGIPVLNQTVLLAGVNDDADTLRRLFKRLAALRVKPHYLFHIDPIEGVSHFATGIAKGLEILNEFRATPLLDCDSRVCD